MKQLFLFLCMVSTAGLLTSAPRVPGGAQDGGDSTAEQALLQTERDWADAMIKNDVNTIARTEADDYTYFIGSMSGDKQADLADARNGAFGGSAELTGMKARIYGDAAVVTGKASLRNAKYKGADVSGDYVFTDTFVKKDGRWQVIASHAHKLQTK